MSKTIVCCPYVDKDNQKCTNPRCVRMYGLECKLYNRKDLRALGIMKNIRKYKDEKAK